MRAESLALDLDVGGMPLNVRVNPARLRRVRRDFAPPRVAPGDADSTCRDSGATSPASGGASAELRVTPPGATRVRPRRRTPGGIGRSSTRSRGVSMKSLARSVSVRCAPRGPPRRRGVPAAVHRASAAHHARRLGIGPNRPGLGGPREHVANSRLPAAVGVGAPRALGGIAARSWWRSARVGRACADNGGRSSAPCGPHPGGGGVPSKSWSVPFRGRQRVRICPSHTSHHSQVTPARYLRVQ